MKKLGSIYFMQVKNNDGYIKIGYSLNINTRLSDIQTGSPYPIEILTFFPEQEKRMEKYIHNNLKNSRIRGEWFYPTEEVMNLVNALRNKYIFYK